MCFVSQHQRFLRILLAFSVLLLFDTRLSDTHVPDGRIRRARAAVDRRRHRRVRLLRVLVLDAVRLARQRGRRVGARLLLV